MRVLGHRQTKGAATDNPNLRSPRHISTLPSPRRNQSIITVMWIMNTDGWVTNRLMRVIPRFGYRLTEFACLAAASKATRAANLVFPCKPDGYLLGSYRIATTPEPNSSRLTSFKSTHFDSPANNVGPWPASLGCTKNSYSSIPALQKNRRSHTA